ncbi:MAG: 3-methylcrotonyl-CoA carboxylase [Gammaproteobacteria bacterium]|nr:MAG: 3-methylcrotonyl-CoA carboxylase [Gammaproteobacteria bacterium]
MFDKILIANRGEIACRIISTARRLGIRTVAVYSVADTKSKHVAMADEAWCIGAAPASESYLLAEKIIEVALKSKAKAIHPGYGFLSENAKFAELCTKNNLVFIGPPVAAIEAMGSKSAAKEIMSEAGIPLVPGYHGDDQSTENLLKACLEIGFPVLLKATAGGGGKGMRIVESESEFTEALSSCKREAMASFCDDEILVEKYLTQPRHVEIQVFADNHGNTVHLFERDCSVQRRHQKVIEEAPAPNIKSAIRNAMAEVAIKAAQAIGYSGAGTVEFLYDEDGSFYFMEMNTRLQVEHPVTEMITGIDLVEWQLLVANNQTLPKKQSQIECNGHAFEVRIYAEDPDQDFLPATGKVVHLNIPEQSKNVRVDSGIRQDDEVSIYYDPMIAKLIVWERDRETALARLRGALADYQVVGITTNLKFLSALAANEAFNKLDIDTSLIEKQRQDLFPQKQSATDQSIALAALYIMKRRIKEAKNHAIHSHDPHSPWHQVSGWHNNESNKHQLEFIDNLDNVRVAEVHFQGNEFIIDVNKHSFHASATLDNKKLSAILSGQRLDVQVIEHEQKLHLLSHGNTAVLGLIDNEQQNHDDSAGGNLTAPMPGTVIAVNVEVGDTVCQNQPLIILEAMKMEHTISAPTKGVVVEILYQAGELVADGAELIILNSDED